MKVKACDADSPLARVAGAARRTPARARATDRRRCASGSASRCPDDVGLLNHAPACERLRADRSAGRRGDPPLLSRKRRAGGAAASRCCRPASRRALARGGAAGRPRRPRCGRGCASTPTDRSICWPTGAFAPPIAARCGCRAATWSIRPAATRRCSPTWCRSATARRCSTSAPAAASRRWRSRRVRRGVVAVDIGARAAALARLNAALNGADRVEVRSGDLYAPVRGERFDLVLANPPFVPAPERGPAYHSGGPRGDRVLRRVVRGLGAHLRDGGRAVIVLASGAAPRRDGGRRGGAVGARLRRARAGAGARDGDAGRPGGRAGAVRARRRVCRLRPRGAHMGGVSAAASHRADRAAADRRRAQRARRGSRSSRPFSARCRCRCRSRPAR